MISLQEVLRVGSGLPAQDLHTLLFARKLAGNSKKFLKATVDGYPCVLENSAGKNLVSYRIYGSEDGVGDLVENGENSGKYEVRIACRGKNWFNKNGIEWESGILDDDGNNTDSTVSHFTMNFIRVMSGVTYTWSGDKGNKSQSTRVYFYDNEKKWLGRTAPYSATTPMTIVIPDNCIYVRLQAIADKSIDDWQLELGSEATEYEPYREPVTTSIFLEKPLKTGEILKYPENVLVHADGTEENIVFPEIPTFSGTTIIETDTEIQSSYMEITYKERLSQ